MLNKHLLSISESWCGSKPNDKQISAEFLMNTPVIKKRQMANGINLRIWFKSQQRTHIQR